MLPLPITVLFLVAVNLIPLFGVLFFGWSLFSIMFLYWIENGIIGFSNIFKIALARAPSSGGSGFTINGRPVSPSNKEIRIIFFIFHYGLFWTVHGIFVFVFFGMTSSSELFGGVGLRGVAIAAAALFLSHGLSFFVNFLGKEEYLTVSPDQQMMEPYSRVVVLHVTILAGGFFADSLGAPLAALVLLILLKTVIDLLAHLREHRKAQMRSGPAAPAGG
ncbi:MAG: DUF6498-containing protein [Actinobacteria bacterium]|nr:DUF6498-containing protein [Actinomycetota bacterium]